MRRQLDREAARDLDDQEETDLTTADRLADLGAAAAHLAASPHSVRRGLPGWPATQPALLPDRAHVLREGRIRVDPSPPPAPGNPG